MPEYTMATKPRILRGGDTVTQELTIKPGTKTLMVTTPCCGVTYRLKLEDVDWHLGTRRPLIINCGKVLNGRGNRPGDPGCQWPYDVLFRRETVARITAMWKA